MFYMLLRENETKSCEDLKELSQSIIKKRVVFWRFFIVGFLLLREL